MCHIIHAKEFLDLNFNQAVIDKIYPKEKTNKQTNRHTNKQTNNAIFAPNFTYSQKL